MFLSLPSINEYVWLAELQDKTLVESLNLISFTGVKKLSIKYVLNTSMKKNNNVITDSQISIELGVITFIAKYIHVRLSISHSQVFKYFLKFNIFK